MIPNLSPITRHFSQVSEAMTLLDWNEINQVVNIIRLVKQKGGTMYLCGNGGSHTTASHFANDLMKIAKVRAVCIGDMTTAMLAFGNDDGWEEMFSSPLHEMLSLNDGVLGISCSGVSKNVIEALRLAVRKRNLAIGFTGPRDDSIINVSGLDALVHVRADDIRVQEDVHLMICHAVVRSLKEEQ